MRENGPAIPPDLLRFSSGLMELGLMELVLIELRQLNRVRTENTVVHFRHGHDGHL